MRGGTRFDVILSVLYFWCVAGVMCAKCFPILTVSVRRILLTLHSLRYPGENSQI